MSVQAGMAAGSTVAVALRFYTRIIITRNVRWDDWLMLIALVRVLFPPSLRSCSGKAAHTPFLFSRAIQWPLSPLLPTP